MEDHQFAWILWYIWKARNNKVFSNLDMDPMDTLKLDETESTLWAEAQVVNDQRKTPQIIYAILPSIPGRWCFTDGSWKEGDSFSGQGWLSTLEGFDDYLEYIKTLKESFTRSEIIYVPRTQNSKVDSLARSARNQLSFIVYMDSDHPVWFTESV
ncbi:hypothetical protein Bca4012_033014 [Brassica carinata]